MPQQNPLARFGSVQERRGVGAPRLSALALALVCLLSAGAAAQPQRDQRPKGQGEPNAQAARIKGKLTPLRTSDTGDGSRVTITSTSPLSDYSAYRSGDRFFVLIPNSDAGAVRSGVRGKGFEDAQVQKRGDDVLLSFRVEPGAKPRVAQRFNQLDVVFAAPNEQAQQQQSSGQTDTPPTQQNNNNASTQTTTRQQPNGQETQPGQPDAARTTPTRDPASEQSAQHQTQEAAAHNADGANAQTPPAPAGQESAATSTAAPTAEPTQLAEARAPAQPVKVTTDQPAQAQPSTSFAAAIANNWPLALIATLLLVGLGLFFVARRSSATSAAPPPPAALHDVETTPAAARVETQAPAAARVAPVTPVAAPKVEKKAEPVVEQKPVVEPTPAVETKPAVEQAPASVEESVAETVAESAPAVTPVPVVAPVVRTEREETKGGRKKKKRGKKGSAAQTVVAKSPVTIAQEKEPTAEHEAPAVTAVYEAPVVEAAETTEIAEAQVGAETQEIGAETQQLGTETQQLLAETQQIEVEPPPAEVSSQVEAAPLVEEAHAVSEAPVEESPAVVAEAPEETAFTEPPVEESPLEEQAIAPSVVVAPLFAESPAVAEAPEAEESEEVAPALDAQPAVAEEPADGESTAIEPAPLEAAEASTFDLDPDAAHAEVGRLLDGAPYDRGLAAVTDTLARNMVAAELLSALAGRNPERRARAHTAFVEHGYFNEATQKLRNSEAPVERASAARALGLAGDRLATPDLVAALEDRSMEVRRAAVEALAAVRDPSAAGPLEAMLERERRERFRVPRRLIEHAVEVCREAPASSSSTLAEQAAAGLAAAPEATGQTAAEPQAVETEPAHVAEPSHAETPTSQVEELAAAPALEEAAATVEETAAEETAPVAFEEPPTLVTSDETVAEETHVGFEPDAQEFEAPSEEAPAAARLPSWIVGEASGEAPAETSAEESAAPQLFEAPPAAEIEEHAAVVEEPPAPLFEEPAAAFEAPSPAADADAPPETPFAPVGGFETSAGQETHAASDDWIDLDIAEVQVGGAAAREEASEPASRELVSSGPAPAVDAAYAFDYATPAADAAPEQPRAEASGPAPATAIMPFDESDMSAVPKAIQLRLGSPEPEIRAEAVKELAHVTTDDAFRVICNGFDDPTSEVRSAAARSLHALQADRAEAFTRALRESTPQRRRNIGASIATSGLAAEAISQLTGESREKTYEAFSLLFLMAKAGEVQPLLRAVEAHPDNEVRLAVVKLLALSGQKDVLPAFRRLAVRNTLPQEVRTAVMEAIYQISSQTVA